MEPTDIDTVESSPADYSSQNQNLNELDRLREYLIDCSEDFFHEVEGSYLFKGCDMPEILRRLDEEEKEYLAWREKQVRSKYPKKSPLQRSKWQYEKRIQQPGYQSYRKYLLKAMRKSEVDPETILIHEDHKFWELRQYVKRSKSSPLPGGPLELQRAGRYDELLQLCLRDEENLECNASVVYSQLPEADAAHYLMSIFRYIMRYFELDVQPVNKGLIQNVTALRHRKALGSQLSQREQEILDWRNWIASFPCTKSNYQEDLYEEFHYDSEDLC
ncbi:hypothetical protein ABVK25_010972 [Lepraria finkii]|uniref:Uncharacterized protein n=1 Tax=Lepraria finkii TaxID=1340010 RepID=A0ABR4ATJ5_9LECA